MFLNLFEENVWTVSELTRYLRGILEDDENLINIWVQGEVSNFSTPSSGHLYFTLKDTYSALRCVMWRSVAQKLSNIPKDGDALQCHGSISIYEASGQYQLYVDRIIQVGEGALYQQFIELKTKLQAEGLFDEQRKSVFPRYPQKIGVITSPTGAAVQDILNTIQRRYPIVEIILAGVTVQGSEAPGQVINAIDILNTIHKPDAIILARGGGSIEDLWAFNDEELARKISASQIPIISGVGHETDFTIADFASDLRAPTPTAAAEMVTPNKNEIILALGQTSEQLKNRIFELTSYQRTLVNQISRELLIHSPLNRIRSNRQRIDDFISHIQISMSKKLAIYASQTTGIQKILGSLNPNTALKRGYAIITDIQGSPIRSIRQVNPNDNIRIKVSDGQFSATVSSINDNKNTGQQLQE